MNRYELLMTRIEFLERQMRAFIQQEAKAREELSARFSQILTEQREEIVRLCKELAIERKDKHRRYTNARNIFESE